MPISFITIKSLLKSLPSSPGVYKMKDEASQIIYIGKAKNIRHRVGQYFGESLSRSARTKKMIEKIADIDVIETDSEFEALVLETNLIKEFRPRYNVLMRDDKNYVYIKVSTNEDYPRLSIVRKREHDGAIYFGPKTSADACEKLISLLRKIFPIRTCGLEMHDDQNLQIVITKKTCPIPCLDYHIKRCRAPCINLIKKEEYAELIKQIVRFLQGQYQDLITRLKYQMFNAAREKKYETAAKIRDQIKGIETIFLKQHVSDPEFIDRDVIGVFPDFDKTFINLFQFREGKLVNQENFAFDSPQGLPAEHSGSVIESFLRSYYSEASDIPTEIFLREKPDDAELWEQWLSKKRQEENARDSSAPPPPLSPRVGRNDTKEEVGMTKNKVKLITPIIGKKNKILELSEKNAASFGKQSRAKWMSDTAKTTQACADLAQELGLDRVLQRIECYDISHLGGEDTTASMVVFIKGSPQPKLYRHFKLKTLETGEVDDYKALEEVLTRRLQRLSAFSSPNLAQYTFKKPLKKDLSVIPTEVAGGGRVEESLALMGIYYKENGEDQLVGYCRLANFNEGKTLCIEEIFIEGEHDTRALRHQLLKAVTNKCDLPHIYAICNKDRKEDFLSFGFTELKKVPEVLDIAAERYAFRDHPERAGRCPTRSVAEGRASERGLSEAGAGRPSGSRKAYLSTAVFLIHKITKKSPDESFNASPDLIIVDGGKGQLSSAIKALTASGLDIPIIGLAKQEEEIFMTDRSIILSRNSQALYLVQRIRDESHRFANDLRKKIGTKKLTESDIDSIPGIGQILKRRLLKEYGSINGIKKAPLEALERTVGTGVARMLRERLK